MKAVAASKLKAAEKRKDEVVPFWNSSSGLIKEQPFSDDIKSVLIVLIMSDRGLCGNANSSVARAALKYMVENNYESVELVCIGDKARSSMISRHPGKVKFLMTELDKKPLTFQDVLPAAEKIATSKFDKFVIVSNKYINSITFQTYFRFVNPKDVIINSVKKTMSNVQFEGDSADILDNLYSYYMAVMLYCSIIENQVCEIGCRMSSMDNASKNASEMLQKIGLQYNRKRQATITGELIEIISGASSIDEEVEL